VSNYTDPGQHFYWLSSRAFGAVALILVSLSIGFGLSLSGRFSREPPYTKQLHEALSLAALVAIAAHGLLLLGDTYLKPGLAGIAIPFVIRTSRFWTGLGVIGGWAAALLGLSFYARKWIGTKRWRSMHRWTLAVYFLAIGHTIGSGTDGLSLWMIAIMVATAVPIVGMALYRWLPAEESVGGRASDAAAPSL
jgi:sulfoxide reductase heme-binding subunit YedZ